MGNFKRLLSLFLEEDAVTGIEYALMGSLIAVVIVTAVAGVGLNVQALFLDVAGKVASAVSGAL